MKCEVIKDVKLTVKKGSVVEIDPLQFELCRAYLKPVEEKKTVKKTVNK